MILEGVDVWATADKWSGYLIGWTIKAHVLEKHHKIVHAFYFPTETTPTLESYNIKYLTNSTKNVKLMELLISIENKQLFQGIGV